jgi:hypothetical protein
MGTHMGQTPKGVCVQMQMELWEFRSTVPTRALAGFDVEARDGGIGKIDESTEEIGTAALVVDTGPWIFGRKVLLPAGTVERVDHEDEKVYVDRSKDQIKDAPEFDPHTGADDAYRSRLGGYYDKTYRTGM